jgi:hypothetical protein
MEQLSVGCHPRLIYDAAAAAKTVSVFSKPGQVIQKLFSSNFLATQLDKITRRGFGRCRGQELKEIL